MTAKSNQESNQYTTKTGMLTHDREEQPREQNKDWKNKDRHFQWPTAREHGLCAWLVKVGW